jgi:hypothetical protein
MERQGGKALHDLDTLGVIVLAAEPIHHKLEGLVRRTVDFLRTRPVGVRPYNLLDVQFLVDMVVSESITIFSLGYLSREASSSS